MNRVVGAATSRARASHDGTWIDAMGLADAALYLGAFGVAGFGIVTQILLLRGKRVRAQAAVVAGCLCLALALPSLLLGVVPLAARFLLSVGGTVLVCGFDAARSRSLRHVMLHAANWVFVSVSAYFVWMTKYPATFAQLWFDLLPSAVDAFDVLLLCQLAFNLGYLVLWYVLGPLRVALGPLFSSTRSPFVLENPRGSDDELTLLFVLLGLGSISRVWNFSNGIILYVQGTSLPSEASSLVGQFDRLFYVGWLFGAALVFTGRRPLRSRVGALTAGTVLFELAYQLISGSKGRFFYFVIQPLAGIYVLSKKRTRPLVASGFVAVALVSWLVVYPTLVSYRVDVSDVAPTSVGGAVDVFAQTAQRRSREPGSYWETVLVPITESNRAEFVTALTSIVRFQVAENPNVFWERMFLFWVPRFVWPGKPVALDANRIGRLSGRLNEGDTVTSVIITGPGETYLYYGEFGFALMMLGGLFLRIGESATSPFRKPSVMRVATFVAFFDAMLACIGGQFESSLTGMLQQLAVLYLAFFLAKLIRSNSARAQRRRNGNKLAQGAKSD